MADLLDPPQGLLSLQTINRGLNGGIGRASALREGFLNFANGARPTSPEHLHNLEFQLGELGQLHREQLSSYVRLLYEYVFCKPLSCLLRSGLALPVLACRVNSCDVAP